MKYIKLLRVVAMNKLDYIIEMLEKLCYYSNIDTEPMRTGIYYKYCVYYKGLFVNSFKSLRQAEDFISLNFGNNSDVFIVAETISQ